MNAVHANYEKRENAEAATHAMGRAIDTLDLSEVAPTLHFDVGGYSVLLLKEVLDRLDLPPVNEIPGADEGLERWTIPGTEIVIVRIKEGELAGQYLFSSQSVERVQEFYDKVSDLPYLPGRLFVRIFYVL